MTGNGGEPTPAQLIADLCVLRTRALATDAANREYPNSEMRVNAEGPRDILAGPPEWWWDEDMRNRAEGNGQ